MAINVKNVGLRGRLERIFCASESCCFSETYNGKKYKALILKYKAHILK